MRLAQVALAVALVNVACVSSEAVKPVEVREGELCTSGLLDCPCTSNAECEPGTVCAISVHHLPDYPTAICATEVKKGQACAQGLVPVELATGFACVHPCENEADCQSGMCSEPPNDPDGLTYCSWGASVQP